MVQRFAGEIMSPAKEKQLTPTELIYLQMLVDGSEIKEMGLKMGVTKFVAYFHLDRIRKKMGARTNPQAAVIAVTSGIIHPSENHG
jgi:DNA-binding CsgD family transcriptional regulator